MDSTQVDWIAIINVVLTIVSGFGAWKSVAYYKKSKQITIYANTNIAYIECQKIIETFPNMLRLANVRNRRGINHINEICQNGQQIKISINKIRENMAVKDFEEIKKILNSDELKVEMYIDSFITGSVLVDNELIIDDKFNLCQEKFYEMQSLIKMKLEDISENLK